MKLTNHLRDAYVRAVMADVPEIDHEAQVRKIVQEVALAALPPAVRALYLDAKTRDLIATHMVQTHRFHIWAIPGVKAATLPAAADKKIAELAAAKAAQTVLRKDLQSKVHATAYSVTTRKALAALLPEFEKYLPDDEQAAIRTLPVVQNVIADFVKAGWPKGKKLAKTAAVA